MQTFTGKQIQTAVLVGAGKRWPRLQTGEQALGTPRRESDCNLHGSHATNCPRMSTEVCSNCVQKQGRVPILCRRAPTTWRQRAPWSATLCSLGSTEEFKPPAAWACSDLPPPPPQIEVHGVETESHRQQRGAMVVHRSVCLCSQRQSTAWIPPAT